MPLRLIPGQKFYTAGTGIEIDNDKVISLNLRDENNLIFVNENNEVYVDLQLPDGIEPTDAFPVGVTTGRVVVADGWDKAGTIISAKTTSGDEIKVLYADEGTLWIDNGTGTFKQIYFKADVDAIAQAIWNYISANCNTKTFYDGTYGVSLAQAVYDWISQGNFGIVYFNPVQGIKRDVIFPPTTTETGTISSWSYTDVRQAIGGMFYEEDITGTFTVSNGVATSGVNFNGTVINNEGRIILSQSTAPSNPLEGTTWYDTTSDSMKVYDGTAWQSVGGGDVLVSDQANNIFTPGMKIWGGTESDYQSLTPDSNTAYLLLAGGPTPGGRQPGVNTVLYVPMNTDLLDHGPDSLTLTNNGVSLVSSQADISVGYFDGSSYLSGAALSSFGDFHVSVWVKLSSLSGSQFVFSGVDSGDIFLGYQTAGGDKIGIGRNGIAWDNTTNYTLSTDTWYLLSFDRQGSTLTFSVNANAIGTHNNTRSYPTAGGFEIGNDGTGNTITGYMSNVIVESVGWTEQENQDYFDQTKGDYGIS